MHKPKYTDNLIICPFILLTHDRHCSDVVRGRAERNKQSGQFVVIYNLNTYASMTDRQRHRMLHICRVAICLCSRDDETTLSLSEMWALQHGYVKGRSRDAHHDALHVYRYALASSPDLFHRWPAPRLYFMCFMLAGWPFKNCPLQCIWWRYPHWKRRIGWLQIYTEKNAKVLGWAIRLYAVYAVLANLLLFRHVKCFIS